MAVALQVCRQEQLKFSRKKSKFPPRNGPFFMSKGDIVSVASAQHL